jgi:hypothetical protein
MKHNLTMQVKFFQNSQLQIYLQVWTMEGANFADQVVRITKAIGSTKARDWATVLGISEQAVSKALKKKQIPRNWFYKISTKLNLSLEWLLNGQEPMQAKAEKITQQIDCANCLNYIKNLFNRRNESLR